MEQEKFEQWALVELFGHQQIAGIVSEQTIGGCSFVRVDVPDTEHSKGFTKFYGNGAIYAITPCSEEAARIAAQKLEIRPISQWIVPDKLQLPEPAQDGFVYDRDEYPSDDEF